MVKSNMMFMRRNILLNIVGFLYIAGNQSNPIVLMKRLAEPLEQPLSVGFLYVFNIVIQSAS